MLDELVDYDMIGCPAHAVKREDASTELLSPSPMIWKLGASPHEDFNLSIVKLKTTDLLAAECGVDGHVWICG
jgi:hypothetical protein